MVTCTVLQNIGSIFVHAIMVAQRRWESSTSDTSESDKVLGWEVRQWSAEANCQQFVTPNHELLLLALYSVTPWEY